MKESEPSDCMACVGLIDLCGIALLILGSMTFFCHCLKCGGHIAPDQPYCYICPPREGHRVSSTVEQEGCL